MLIYNTLSGKKEDLDKVLSGGKKLRLFVCGPTVYDYAHIGNARTYISFDIIVNYLRSSGLKVFYLQNLTDIDDKIIQRAVEEKATASAVAKKYERAYHEDEKALGIKSVSKYAPATKYIKQIVVQIQALIKKGHAYKIEGDGYYFDISTFPEYGKLSKRTVAQAEDSVSRIDESVNKKNKGDFALWKLKQLPKRGLTRTRRGLTQKILNRPVLIDGEPVWRTPLGWGRPGWHIEDTAITEKHFGPQYDIHGGAIDLKFPHHEAEIAQQESASGLKPLAKIWLHTGFLLVNGEKMSKSLGNFITIRDFLKKRSSATLRYIVASHHYRSPIDYAEEMARQAGNTLENLAQFVSKLRLVKKPNLSRLNLDRFENAFSAAMSDDFNTPQALAAVHDLVNEAISKIWELDKADAKKIAKWLPEKLGLLGIELKSPKIPLKIKLLAKKRELFRRSKQFVQSDVLRHQIEMLGYTVEDTPVGPFLWPVNPKF